MRVADICPTCATFINASCIIYGGEQYLSNILTEPLQPLDEILENINNAFETPVNNTVPTAVPQYLGQLYYNPTTSNLYIGLSNSIPNWGFLGTVITTTTTTSSTSTSSSSTTTSTTTL